MRIRAYTQRMNDFNPRPPRGGRLINWVTDNGDTKFQSTPPARGATAIAAAVAGKWVISIHAPREGGDPVVSKSMTT